MTVDLNVVCYNNRPQLLRLINELHSDADRYCQPWTLRIADNGSTDGTQTMLYHQTQDRELYIRDFMYNENIGYAAACNQLAKCGDGRIIGLLNADVWLTTAHVRQIEQSFAANPDMAIMGPKQRNEEGRITHAGIFGTNTEPKMRGWKENDPDDKLYRELEQCLTVAGSAYFIRREVWDTLTQCAIYQQFTSGAEGAFLPTDHYYEETFCSYHAGAHGFKVYYDGTIGGIGHTWHASAPQGGGRDHVWQQSEAMFRQACDYHGIDHN